MFKTKCAECEKEMFAYATNRSGDLPVVYCSKVCEGKAKEKAKFKNQVNYEQTS